MSRHHNEDETEMVNTKNGENTISRRNTHLHLKPTLVFDHIKTKVKRKRTSNNNRTELPAFATNNNNNIPKRINQEQNELDLKTTFIQTGSQPIHVMPPSDDDNHENKKNELNNDEHPSIVSDYEDAALIESVQWRSNPIESDIETSTKTAISKIKLNKSIKSPSESTIKKRRQSTRRTVLSSLILSRK
jgi:hypothetical protein